MRNLILGLGAIIMVLASCKKDDLPEAPRLFRPVVAKDGLMSEGNWISAAWQGINGAASYTVQISRDTFRTIDVTMTVDSNYAMFENLSWNQLYQIQVRANAQDTVKNSKYSNLGAVKTPKFPTILIAPTSNDATDVAAIVRWTTGGDPVTSIKVLKASDSSLVREVTLTNTDVANEYRRINGLTGSTDYIMYLYSGEKIRGWENYTTKAPLLFPGSTIVDLRGDDRSEALSEALQNYTSGSVIILERGMTYNISSTTKFGGSVTILSGLGFDPVAKINFGSNFDLVAGSTIDSIMFRDVEMRGADFGGTYVMNIDAGGTVGKVVFEGCNVTNFRGVVRIKASSPVTISNFTFSNCIIDSINGYGVLNVDNTAAKVENVVMKNSTIYKVQNVLVSKNSSNSVLIENCTFFQAPLSGNFFVNYNGNNVTEPIKIYNSIIGPGWAKVGTTTTDVKGYKAGGSTSLDISNTYSTADYKLSTSTDASPLPNLSAYSRPSAEIFQDPENGDFKLIDRSFPEAGDPRWR
jgi:hypothetical protein